MGTRPQYYIVTPQNGLLCCIAGPFGSWAEADEEYDAIVEGKALPLWIVEESELRSEQWEFDLLETS